MIMNKKGGATDLILLVIFLFVFAVFAGLMIFSVNEINSALKENVGAFEKVMDKDDNATKLIDDTVGKVIASYGNLNWIGVALAMFMVMAIFIGSFLVRTHPIFFIPYILLAIAIIVISFPISNAYEEIISQDTLTASFAELPTTNYLLLNLPIWLTVVAFIGGIILFASFITREEAGVSVI